MNALTRRFLPYILALAVLLAILLVWQLYATTNPTFYLPPPTVIWDALRTDWFSGPPVTAFLNADALAAIGQTFASALAGWGIATVVGVVGGVLIGRWAAFGDVTNLPLLLLRSIPPVAVIPICIVIFGIGFEMKVVVVAFGAIWPILLNTASGVSQIDKEILDVATLYRLGPVARFFRILTPAASPKIFAGLRVSLSFAIIMAVGAEMLAGSGGLGGMTIRAQSTFDVPALWATLFVIALFGLVINYGFLYTERLALWWHTKRSLQ